MQGVRGPVCQGERAGDWRAAPPGANRSPLPSPDELQPLRCKCLHAHACGYFGSGGVEAAEEPEAQTALAGWSREDLTSGGRGRWSRPRARRQQAGSYLSRRMCRWSPYRVDLEHRLMERVFPFASTRPAAI